MEPPYRDKKVVRCLCTFSTPFWTNLNFCIPIFCGINVQNKSGSALTGSTTGCWRTIEIAESVPTTTRVPLVRLRRSHLRSCFRIPGKVWILDRGSITSCPRWCRRNLAGLGFVDIVMNRSLLSIFFCLFYCSARSSGH
jgi:hypothetical protein